MSTNTGPKKQLSDYSLFQGITPTDLKVLLPCVNARLQYLPKGSSQVLSEPRDKVYSFVLSGELILSSFMDEDLNNLFDEIRHVSEDESIPEGFHGIMTAVSDTCLLNMDRHMMFSPCWFSCSFHHRLMENS